MGPAFLAWSATAALASLALHLVGGPVDFHPAACAQVRSHVPSVIVGQPLATAALAAAVCDHVANAAPTKPLVLSAHGPPGVGKSLSHAALAAALYRRDPAAAAAASSCPPCPGRGCPGYRVVFGLDYGPGPDAAATLAALKTALLDHAASHPQSLIVVEEYDKLDCAARAMLRGLVAPAPGDPARAALARAIIVLESNAGHADLHALVADAGRDAVTLEAATRAVKDALYASWAAPSCEPRADTLRALAAVDHVLPFLPLERSHLETLIERALVARTQRAAAGSPPVRATWGADLISFLADRADYDSSRRFPVEGGAEAPRLVTRYVSGALQDAAAAAGAGSGGLTGRLVVGVDANGVLFVPDPPASVEADLDPAAATA
jgi:Torsin